MPRHLGQMEQQPLPLFADHSQPESAVESVNLIILGEHWEGSFDHFSLTVSGRPDAASYRLSVSKYDVLFLNSIDVETARNEDQLRALFERCITRHLTTKLGCCWYWYRNPSAFPGETYPEPINGRYMPVLGSFYDQWRMENQA